MMDWIITNISTILVSLVLVVLVTIVIRKLLEDKKKGVTSCGTSCSGCAMAGNCKEFQNKEK
jgi:FeoB-associated Cys-rich membrane protein